MSLFPGAALAADREPVAGTGVVALPTDPGEPAPPLSLAQTPPQAPDDADGLLPDPAPIAPAPADPPPQGAGAAWTIVLAVWALLALVLIARWRLWRLPRPDEPEGPGARLDAGRIGLMLLLAGLLLWLGKLLGAASAQGLLELGTDRSLRADALRLLGAYVGVGATLGFVVAVLPRAAGAAGLTARPGDIGAGALGFAIVFPLAGLLGVAAMAAARSLAGAEVDPLAHGTLKGLVAEETGVWWWATIALVCVGAPVVEEVMYRGMLQGGLARLTGSRRGAILFVSLAFTFQHVGAADPHALPTLFLLSVAFGVAYERTGRLAAPIVMHALFNGANVLIALLPA